jgi:hypothetical protein
VGKRREEREGIVGEWESSMRDVGGLMGGIIGGVIMN